MITLDTLRETWTDEQLIELANSVLKAHDTGLSKKDFIEKYGIATTYNSIDKVLVARGCVNNWHKLQASQIEPRKPVKPQSGAVEIEMKKIFGETSRVPYMVSKTVADEWRAFVKPFAMKSVPFDHALLSFMEAYNTGKIKFVLEKSQPDPEEP